MAKQMDVRTIDIAKLTVRDADGGAMKIEGYGTVFNQQSQWLGFYEYIEPTAFDGVDLSGMLLLYNHDYDNILSRVDSQSMTVDVDGEGLHFVATLPNTTLGRDTYENVKNGNLKGCSFGFTIADGGDTWTTDDDGAPVHIVNQIDTATEISLTAIPAYTQTSVAVTRSLTKFKESEAKRMDELKELKREVESLRAMLKRDAEDDKKKDDDKPADDNKDDKPATDETPADGESDGKSDETPADDGKSDDDKKKETDDVKKAETGEKREEKRDDSDEYPDDNVDDEEPQEERSQPVSENQEERSVNKMGKQITTVKDPAEEKRNAFINYLKNPETINRDALTGMVAADGSAVIPEEILATYKQPNDPNVLASYVNKVAVTSPGGHVPFIAKQSVRLTTAAELAENPALQKMKVTQVDYNLSTYRGQLPISYETLQDAPSLAPLISQYVQDSKANTEQYKIGEVLKSATTTLEAKTADDLKDALNKGLANYQSNVMWIVTESFFAELDKLKDNEGRYLLQDNISATTGKALFGKTVVVVPDDVLGAAGDKVAFLGDPRAFCMEVYKGDMALEWDKNEYFGRILAAVIRLDFKKVDDAAGKFITWTAKAVATTSTPGK